MAITKLQSEGLAKPVDLDDNEKIRLGTDNDFELYHTGTGAYIQNKTGTLFIGSNYDDDDGGDIRIQPKYGENSIVALDDGAVELYHDNVKKFETYSGGVIVTGQISADLVSLGDNEKITLGTGDDLEIYHSGSHSYITNTGTGHLYIKDAGIVKIISDSFKVDNAAESKQIIKTTSDAVELYQNNTKRFETTSSGATVTGTLTATSFSGDGSNLTGVSSVGGATGVDFNDNVKARFGTGNDLEIYHTGSHSFIDDTGTGDMYIRGDNALKIQNAAGSEQKIVANTNGSVDLYYDNHKAFETTDFGSQTVFSSAGGSTPIFKVLHGNLTQGIGIGYDSINAVGSSSNVPIFLRSKGTGNVEVVTSGSETMAKFIPNAQVELYYNNSAQLYTVDGGISVGLNGRLNNAKGTFANDGTHLSLRSFATGGYDSIIFRSANTTVGRIHFNSGGTQYHTSSDYRRKDNIVNLTGAIDRVKTLLPKRFNFKTEPSVTRDGFLAHEVTTVPEAVLGIKDQIATEKDVEDGKAEAVGDPIYQTIDQSALVPLLTAAVKELIAKVEVLEAA